MRVFSKSSLITFWQKHTEAEQSLKAWHDEAISADWKTPQDIKNRYKSASIIGNDRIVFNIKGNEFRLIVSIAYPFGAVFIKFIGTHAQYDKVDAVTVEM